MAVVKLADICQKIGSGATPRGGKEAYRAEGIALVRSQNVLDFSFSSDGLAYINDEQADKLRNVELQSGDVLLNITGDSVARACLMDDDYLPGRVNQHVAIIRVDESKAVNSYLLYYLQWRKSHLLQLASAGATRNALTKGMIEQLEIDLPSLDEQRKVVGILGSIQNKIKLNHEINDNLEQQAATYFQELFINNANPVWQISTISDLGTVVGGSTPSKTKPEYYTNNGIAWITPKDLSINKSKFISHGENDITELGLKNSSATVMPKGTVLFSSRAPIGYIAIASNEVTTNQGFKSVIPYSEIGTAFVYFFLKHSLPVIESAASGSTFKEISGSAMKNIPAIIPDRNTLDQFNSFCAPIFAQQKILEEQNHSLAMLRDSLLPKLMSGAIDIASIQL
ncbi:restriction endonuclease subunit S [Faecalibacterium prausnitzii]|mgnify:CR=1 FL=1|uniref:restriction endonuclease subunit S n=1 Tax=Faecalibacterium prausnitzii TaxID=853 RepID=UPI0020B81D4C|nr:restriction endonuclease subunit S [Faecalibacterium prausnitzii]MCQ5163179.1 restriction endonuclease subunit S [Faecalibacterium prausnitzii]